MTVTGLDNNYYLCRNDIWINVTQENTKNLEIKVKNIVSEKEFSFRLQPINNEYYFNISLPIRALFEPINHLSNPLNTMQEFSIEITGYQQESEEKITFRKQFIYGFREKQNAKNENWNLNMGEFLHNGVFPIFDIPLLMPYYIITNLGVTYYYPFGSETMNFNLKNKCNAKVLKFLNSLGGYSYFAFENFEKKTKVKSGKVIGRIATQLNKNTFENLENEIEDTIEFKTKTPEILQPLFRELAMSHDVYMYVTGGHTEEDKWIKLKPENNDTLYNSWDFSYENKISFSF